MSQTVPCWDLEFEGICPVKSFKVLEFDVEEAVEPYPLPTGTVSSAELFINDLSKGQSSYQCFDYCTPYSIDIITSTDGATEQSGEFSVKLTS